MSGSVTPVNCQGSYFYTNTPSVAQALDLQNALAQAEAALSTQGLGKMTTAYCGALNGALQLTNSANFPNLLATGNCSFYLTSYALTQVTGLSAVLGSVVSTFAGAAPGILEVGTDPVNMPDIAANYAANITATNGWTWGTTKGTTWPSIVQASGWKPSVAALNTFQMSYGTLAPSADPYYAMNLAAIADVKAACSSIKYVLPFITPNNAPVAAATGNDQWSNAYWQNYQALALAAGGMMLDIPSNYALHVQSSLYLPLIVQMLQWARQNNLITGILLSPYSLTGGAQEGNDTTFTAATAQVVAYLQSQGVAPTFYVGTNYGEATTSNPPGTDTTANSTSQVALFLATSALTAPYVLNPTFQRAVLPTLPRPPALRDFAGYGDMSYQTSYNVNIQGGSANFTGSVTVPSLSCSGNVNILAGESVAFGVGGGASSYIHADGSGNLTIDPGLATGNVILPGNLNISGTLSSNNNLILSANPTTGVTTVSGKNVEIGESGGGLAFFGHAYASQPAVTGSKSSATVAVLTNLLAALSSLGIISDQTTA